MGCNIGSQKLNIKLQTEAQVRKHFAEEQERDRYENGEQEGYSGTISTIGYLRFTGQKFEIFEDACNEIEERIGKREAWFYQVKVIRETKPLLAARQARQALIEQMWNNQDPKAMVGLRNKVMKLNAKIEKITRAQAAKSNKFQWAVTTACAE